MTGRILVVVAAVALSAGSLSAQATSRPEATPQPAQLAQPTAPVQAAAPAAPAQPSSPSAATLLGPSAAGAELLVPAPATQSAAREVSVARVRRGQPGLALAIVGGALFLGGAIIGGDAGTALMVGGVVVGAVGLYQYLQ